MRYYFNIAAMALAVIFFPLSARGSVVDRRAVQENILNELIAGQTLIFARNYDDALRHFRDMQARYPISPAGFFGEMAVHEVRMLEREDFHLEREFLAAAEKGEKAISQILQYHTPLPLELMFCASLIGLKGFIKARHHSWWSAYVLGTKSRQLFRRIKEVDPTFIDADFGIGMYLYWRTVFAHRLTFISLVPDRRQEGMALVKAVAEQGTIAKELARVNLGMMYFEEKRYREAEGIFSSYVARYPKNILARMFLGRVLMADKRYDESSEQFRQVLDIDSTISYAHYFLGVNLIFKDQPALFAEADRNFEAFLRTKPRPEWQSYVHFWRGHMAEKQGDTKRALQEFEQALALNSGLKQARFRIRGLGGGL